MCHVWGVKSGWHVLTSLWTLALPSVDFVLQFLVGVHLLCHLPEDWTGTFISESFQHAVQWVIVKTALTWCQKGWIRPWRNQLVSLTLSFHICKMDIMLAILPPF